VLRAAVFAYGTLELPQIVTLVLGRRLHGQPATLTGFARFAVHGAPYPALVPRSGARTSGILYRGLDAATLRTLDRYEGRLYRRQAVAVRLTDGRSERCFVYVVRPQHLHLLSRRPWDPKLFARRYLFTYLARCAHRRAPMPETLRSRHASTGAEARRAGPAP
jgi:gamma-glutamylcyclotransferase (GGCT)/AIG2-like uncharacterized protein YtfP